MAFPTIPTVAAGRVLWQLATSPSGTHTSPSLTSLTKNANDLLIAIIIIYDGNSTNAEFSSWGGSFTEFGDFATTTTMGIGCAYKWSTGSETGTFTVTSADTSTNDSAFCLLSIPGAHKTTAPEAGQYASAAGAPPAVAAALNPANWGNEDTLWIAVGGSGETSTVGNYDGISAAPTNYTSYSDSGISADVVGGVEGAVAFRQLNAASEAPGAWTGDTSNARGAAIVIAVRPDGDRTISASGAPGSATGSASLVHIPTLLVPSAFGASTADGLVSLPKLDIINPAASATAAVGTVVIAIAQSRLIDLTGIVSSATASVSTPLVLVTITSPVAQATASSVEPVVTSLVASVVATATASSTAQLPLVTVDAVAISTAFVVAPSVGTLAVVVSVPATATASTLDPLPLLTIATVATANAAIVSPYIDAGLPPVNYANVLIFGN